MYSYFFIPPLSLLLCTRRTVYHQTSTTMMTSTLPTELVQRVLIFCRLKGVAAFLQTCRQSCALVYKGEDQSLWRELFLAVPFDDLTDSLANFRLAGVSLVNSLVLFRELLAEQIITVSTAGHHVTR